jgi:hypothetical protein
MGSRKFFRGCRSGSGKRAKRDDSGASGFKTPHAPSGIRTQPPVDIYIYESVRTLSSKVDSVNAAPTTGVDKNDARRATFFLN